MPAAPAKRVSRMTSKLFISAFTLEIHTRAAWNRATSGGIRMDAERVKPASPARGAEIMAAASVPKPVAESAAARASATSVTPPPVRHITATAQR